MAGAAFFLSRSSSRSSWSSDGHSSSSSSPPREALGRSFSRQESEEKRRKDEDDDDDKDDEDDEFQHPPAFSLPVSPSLSPHPRSFHGLSGTPGMEDEGCMHVSSAARDIVSLERRDRGSAAEAAADDDEEEERGLGGICPSRSFPPPLRLTAAQDTPFLRRESQGTLEAWIADLALQQAEAESQS